MKVFFKNLLKQKPIKNKVYLKKLIVILKDNSMKLNMIFLLIKFMIDIVNFWVLLKEVKKKMYKKNRKRKKLRKQLMLKICKKNKKRKKKV